MQLRSGILIHLALPSTNFVGPLATDSKPEVFTVSDEELPCLFAAWARFSYLLPLSLLRLERLPVAFSISCMMDPASVKKLLRRHPKRFGELHMAPYSFEPFELLYRPRLSHALRCYLDD